MRSKTSFKLPELTKAQHRRLCDFQQLTPEQRLGWMSKAGSVFLRKRPEILQFGPTIPEAVRAYCTLKRKRLELEVLRDRRGRRYLRVVQVRIPKGMLCD